MFRKAFSCGVSLFLVGTVVLVTPGLGQAQHRGGGGHGGGGSHGSVSHGSFNHGSFNHGSFNHGSFNHGSFNHGSFNHGTLNHAGFNHGSFNHGSFNHAGFNHAGRWWYPRNYGYYGAWPSYYGTYPYSSYSDYYGDAYSSDWSRPAYNSGYYGPYGDASSSDPRALITVSVPADAEVWFEGTRMTATGSVREYQSPPLSPSSRYTYEVRARWSENGHEVTQTQRVDVTAGTHVNVQFPVQPTQATAPIR